VRASIKTNFQNPVPAGPRGGRWPFAPVLAAGHYASSHSFGPKSQRAGALQDASRGSFVIGQRASVLDCASPPPFSHGAQI